MPNNYSWHREEAPGYRLAILHRLSAAFLAPLTRKLGLKRAWIGPLLSLLDKPGQSQDSISKSLCIDQAATARVMFELEELGYVHRREDASDRRQKLVEPSAKTLDLAEGLNDALASHNRSLFRGFSPQRRLEALEILDLMIANLKSALESGETSAPQDIPGKS